MIEEQAVVTHVGKGYVNVECLVKSSCSGCQQLDNCGSGQISKAFPQKKVSHKVVTNVALNQGDSVLIGIPEKLILTAAWQVYIWPLIGLLTAGYFGQWLVEQQILAHELLAVILSLLGGYCGFLLAKRRQTALANQSDWSPRLLKILASNIAIVEIDR
ncbi:SoxR reducing system RseC family protein [Thalassotalea sp. G2M2-11]|uniref:SoxR reducing system RseC family protein n=1 Tax=Thalassotalea sp. G2M2-11 TaxID=2787627 RepID=UPI0019D08575|nr:SoxR reducing system RseC family protein [Thalassotalea sp. G2M2-11]